MCAYPCGVGPRIGMHNGQFVNKPTCFVQLYRRPDLSLGKMVPAICFRLVLAEL